MKKALLLLLCFVKMIVTYAQWSDTTNKFDDNLHMPVCNFIKDQKSSFIVRSYPDSGYFLIWEDFRNGVTNKDIYAQKYDKNGQRLWAVDGVPVASGPDAQFFAQLTVIDYRDYSFACTDSANGFYMCWTDENSSAGTSRQRVCVQHIRGDGTATYPNIGSPIAETNGTDNAAYVHPQLIADGYKGFYIAYKKNNLNGSLSVIDVDLYVQNMVEENGILVRKFYDKMNPDIVQGSEPNGCNTAMFTHYFLVNANEYVNEFHLYTNMQKGCNLVWLYERNTAQPLRGPYIAFNSICRVKKNAQVTVARRTGDLLTADIIHKNYQVGDLVKLYSLKTFSYNNSTGNCTQLNIKIENFGDGYRTITQTPIDQIGVPSSFSQFRHVKAGIIKTNSNVNAGLVLVTQKDFLNNVGGNWHVRAYYHEPDEVYDSLPYQLCTDTTHPYFAYNRVPPVGLKRVRFGDDTLLAYGYAPFDYAFAIGGNKAFITGKLVRSNTNNIGEVLLQELKLSQVNTDSFTIRINTNKPQGVLIDKEVTTGSGGNNIALGSPTVSANEYGIGFICNSETGRYLRGSPIDDGGKLRWGGGGKPLGNYFTADESSIMMTQNGTAITSWTDSRGLLNGTNIYMRRLDQMNDPNHHNANTLFSFSTNINYGNLLPTLITGNSQAYTFINARGSNLINTAFIVSTVAAIKDNYNLGVITGQVYDFNGNPRIYNNKPYLNRNYFIKPENNPNGAASILVRLYFTQQQFDLLKTADPSITSPNDLLVIKQPNTNGLVPISYTPVAGEQTIAPLSWNAVDGGYYLEIEVTSFSNFFIQGNSALPLDWLTVLVNRNSQNEAVVKWQVANELNVRNYAVQMSVDNIHFENNCVVPATHNTWYQCAIPIANEKNYFFRVVETDNDGRTNTSKIVALFNTTNKQAYSILPNPATNDVTLYQKQNNASIKSLQLFNIEGKLIWQKNQFDRNVQNEKIALTSFPSGIYYLKIVDANELTTLKLVKQ